MPSKLRCRLVFRFMTVFILWLLHYWFLYVPKLSLTKQSKLNLLSHLPPHYYLLNLFLFLKGIILPLGFHLFYIYFVNYYIIFINVSTHFLKITKWKTKNIGTMSFLNFNIYLLMIENRNFILSLLPPHYSIFFL